MNFQDVFQAVRMNDMDSFIALIDSKDINSIKYDEQNLLHEAAAYDKLECAKELIGRNINIDHKDNSGMTPLHYAAANNSLLVANEILNGGGDLSICDEHGNEPLWTAVFNAKGKYDLVKLYMKYNANPGHKNTYGKSPLDFAQQINDAELVSILTGKNLDHDE